MRPWLLCCILLGLAASAAAQRLPAEFDHNRIFLSASTEDGTALRFLVDSGGGFNAVSQATAQRFKLASVGTIDAGRESFPVVEFPPFLASSGIPAPLPDEWLHGRLAVAPAETLMGSDGFLGSRWLAGRAWRIDYGRHEMALLPDGGKPGVHDRAMPLGFPRNDAGQRVGEMPRIAIAVDGKTFDVLLDTGATFTTSEESAATFGVEPGAGVGGSFITKSIFNAWHARHPDWRVIARGDNLQGKTMLPIIEVPQVRVAGITVGPVWFAQRPDANFTQGMSSMMDKTIHGAFGGSGLQYLHVVLDYPRAKAWVGASAASN